MSKLLNQIIIILFVFTLFVYSFFLPVEMSKSFISMLMVIIGISTLLFFKLKKIQEGSFHWISIKSIFIFGYIIVHYQLALLYVLGYELPKIFVRYFWADINIVNKTLTISTLGILAFYIGAAKSFNFEWGNKKKSTNHVLYENSNSSMFIIVCSYIFYFLFFITSGSYRKGWYWAGDSLPISTYLYTGFNLFLTAGLILKLYYQALRKENQISFSEYFTGFGTPLLLITIWHILFSLYVGDRGPIITYGILLLGLYFTRWKKIKIFQLLIAIFFVASFMTIVGMARTRISNISFNERFLTAMNSENINRFYKQKVPGSQIIELGYSVRCLNHSVANVPSKYDFFLGYFQLQHIVAIVPGASSLYLNLMGKDEKKFDGSANFSTYLIQGNKPKSGDGSTVITDLYLDFDVYGVIVGLFIFGLFISKNEKILFSNVPISLLLWISICVYFSSSLYLSRSNLLLEFQKIIQIYLIILFNNFISSKNKYPI